jgi:hypothetical protein
MTPTDSSSLEANILGTLSRELTHEYTRVRRLAVDRAGEMLKAGQYPLQVKNLLQTVAFRDPSQSVRDMAQQVLDQYKGVVLPKPVSQAGQETIEVCCSIGHTSTFDKHDLYENLGRYWRRSVLHDDKPFQELVLTCQNCGEQIIIDLDFGSLDQ